MTERTIPQSLESEQSTLGAMLMSKDAIIAAMELLSADDFYRELHGKIFAAIVALFEKGDPVDLISAVQELRARKQLEEIGGVAYLTALIEACPSAANVESYAKVVADKSSLRALLKAADAITAQVYAGDSESVPSVIQGAEQSILAVGSKSMRSGATIKTMADYISEYRAELLEMVNNPEKSKGLPTGFIDLDVITNGWQNSDLIIMAARPSMGKTTALAQSMMTAAQAQEKPVVFFSLEMSGKQIIQRMVATESRLDGSKLRRGRVADDEWSLIHRATDRLEKSPLIIVDKPAISVFEMRAHLRKIEQEYGAPAMIAMDYLQLAEHAAHSGRNVNRTQEIEGIVKGCKTLAREYVCPFIALSQLSRAVEMREDKRPILSDLRDSGSIEAEADVVMMIYRGGYYKKSKAATEYEQAEDNVTEFIIGKQRNGPTGTVKVVFDAPSTRFTDYAGDGYLGGVGYE